mgnify:CR=1 FL=1
MCVTANFEKFHALMKLLLKSTVMRHTMPISLFYEKCRPIL